MGIISKTVYKRGKLKKGKMPEYLQADGKLYDSEFEGVLFYPPINLGNAEMAIAECNIDAFWAGRREKRISLQAKEPKISKILRPPLRPRS